MICSVNGDIIIKEKCSANKLKCPDSHIVEVNTSSPSLYHRVQAKSTVWVNARPTVCHTSEIWCEKIILQNRQKWTLIWLNISNV